MSVEQEDAPNVFGLPSGLVEELAQIATAARMQKTLFDEYLKAGFTESQALYMAASIVNGAKQ